MKIIDYRPFYLKPPSKNIFSLFLFPLSAILSVLYYIYYLSIDALNRRTASKNRSHRMPQRKSTDDCTVISVGNLEVGGTGKTPFTVLLSEELIKNGHRVVVVTRGYRRKSRHEKSIVVSVNEEGLKSPSGNTMYTIVDKGLSRSEITELVGDEVVIYKERSVSVVVDNDKTRGLELAKELFAPHFVIIDDGFQHRKVKRDIDIVLLDYSRPFGNGLLLPAGTLREPPFAMERADIVVFTRSISNTVPQRVERYIRGKPYFFSEHILLEFFDREGNRFPINHVREKDITIFSGIARNESFEKMMEQIGATVRDSFRFADHYDYTFLDVERMLRIGNGTVFVTTEKDFYKVADLFPGDVELLALRIGIRVEGLHRLIELLS